MYKLTLFNSSVSVAFCKFVYIHILLHIVGIDTCNKILANTGVPSFYTWAKVLRLYVWQRLLVFIPWEKITFLGLRL